MSLDKRISELPVASKLSLDDVLPLVNNGVTSKVTLRELISELQINIPQPRIKIKKGVRKEVFMDTKEEYYHGHDMVYASWEGSDSSFMKFAPEFWLYRYKKAAKVTYKSEKTGIKSAPLELAVGPVLLEAKSKALEENRGQKTVWRKKRFVHPSHQHGFKYMSDKSENPTGIRLYCGEQFVEVEGKKIQLSGRNTEWEVAGTPLQEKHLDLEPWKYYRLQSSKEPWIDLPETLDTEEQPYPKGTGNDKTRFVVFKVRIAINNPNPNSPEPKLFGPFSETFILFPSKTFKKFDSFRYFLGPETSPRFWSRMK